MNAEILHSYKQHVKNLPEIYKPYTSEKMRVRTSETLDLGKYKIDMEDTYLTKTVSVLGDGKYIGFMAYDDSHTNGTRRQKSWYQVWDVAKGAPLHTIRDEVYCAVPIGKQWFVATKDPDDAHSSLEIYNFLTGDVVSVTEGAYFEYEFLFFGDKYIIVSGGAISCHDLETGAEIFAIPNYDCLHIHNIQFQDDGRLKAVVDEQTVIYDLQTLTVVPDQEGEGTNMFQKFPPANIDKQNACQYSIEEAGSILRECFWLDVIWKEKLLKCQKYRDISFNFAHTEEKECTRPKKKARVAYNFDQEY
jgi:hypothetical protein